ncbi:Protein translocase subunit SecD [Candidatus Hepatincolaceae symbiont of Richtersius coronifer]
MMMDFPSWKRFLTILVALGACVIVFLDFSNKQSKKKEDYGLKLGLDLQGGSSLVLQADEKTFTQDYTNTLYESVRYALSSNNLNYFNLRKEIGSVSFTLKNSEDFSKFRQQMKAFNSGLHVSESNNTVKVAFSEQAYNEQLQATLQNSVEIIRNRIDQTGTNEPSINQHGSNQIVVELPGVDNPEKIKRLLATTARLTFHLADDEATFTRKELRPNYKYIRAADGTDIQYAIKNDPEIYGKSLVSAQLQFEQNKPVVMFAFDTEGAKKFAALTTQQQGKIIAIVMDNKVISAPRINMPITGGSGIITGNFTLEEAQELVLLLRGGSLPVPLNIIEERVVGPTLGSDSIKAGIRAGAIGYVLVFLYMIIFYKKLGLIANVALIINVIIILAALSLLKATLTLPGIAGIILTLGMAVDSNILLYERLSQELKMNKFASKNSFGLALSASFKRVFLTLIDANSTTLFTALFLFYFGSGPIRGFAVTLIIGILTSMFSILFVTRFLINFFLIKKNQKKLKRS